MSHPTDTHLPQNIEQMLVKLAENSKVELDIVRALADGIRRVDEQMLREVRTVALQHEVRREAIFGELQELAGRLCAMPKRSVLQGIAQRGHVTNATAIENRASHNGEGRSLHSGEGRNSNSGEGRMSTNGGGDWRQAAQKIDDELNEIFHADGARH